MLTTTALLPTMVTTATLPVTATTGVLPATVTKSTHSILPEDFSLGLESNNFNTFPFVPPTTGPTHDPFSTMMLELDITSPQAERVLEEFRCIDDDLSWDPYESLKYYSSGIYL